MNNRGDDKAKAIFTDELQSLVSRPITFEDLAQWGRSGSFDDSLTNILNERMAECERVFAEHGFNRSSPKNFPRDAEPFTDLWFAGVIGSDCFMIMRRDYKGYHAADMLRVMQLESHWSDWQWRRAFGQEMRAGKKLRTEAPKARKRGLLTREERFAEIERLKGAMSTKAAFSVLAERERVTSKAIEADYYKAKKYLSQ